MKIEPENGRTTISYNWSDMKNKNRPQDVRSVGLFGTFRTAMSCSSLFVAIPAMVAYGWNGRSAMEKVLTTMVQPLFLICLFLIWIAMVQWAKRDRSIACLIFVVASLLWVVSTPVIGRVVVGRWERQTPATQIDDLALFDTVIVLGGGTGSRPLRDPQFGLSGDRAGFAARMFHRGQAKRLVTTGGVLELKGAIGRYLDSDRPSVQAKRLWMDLGIPEASIETLGGENTSSEMREIAKHPEWWRDKKCGLITSAIHMPRAMMLAKRAGVSLTPIPVNFLTPPSGQPLTVEHFLPQARHLDNMSDLLKEWLGIQLGR
jgi:uncharacterized SAM-binding protein YcdF (DUF218 family)